MLWEPPAVTTAGHQAEDLRQTQVGRGSPSLDLGPPPSNETFPRASLQAAPSLSAAGILKPFKLNPSACEFIPAALRAAHQPVDGSVNGPPSHPSATTSPDPGTELSKSKCASGSLHKSMREPQGRSEMRKPSQEEYLSRRDGWAVHTTLCGESPSPHLSKPSQGQLPTTVPTLDHQLLRLTELPAEVNPCSFPSCALPC